MERVTSADPALVWFCASQVLRVVLGGVLRPVGLGFWVMTKTLHEDGVVLPPVYFVPMDQWAEGDVEVLGGDSAGHSALFGRTLGRWTTSDDPMVLPSALTSRGGVEGRTFLAWSGVPGGAGLRHGQAGGLDVDDPDDVGAALAWMPGSQAVARDRLAELAPRLRGLGVTLAVRPHVDHAIGDVPSLLWLATQYRDGPFSIALDPVSMLAGSMRVNAVDHFRRCAEVGLYLVGLGRLAAVILPPIPAFEEGTGLEDVVAMVGALSPVIFAAQAVVLQADSREEAARQAGWLTGFLSVESGSVE